MQLETIEQIINGMQVYMPSGCTAYLSLDEKGNIIVEYRDELDSYNDVYTQDEFGNIIKDGIEIFEQPSQLVLESMNATKVFELDQQIANLENKLNKVRSEIDMLPIGATLNDNQEKLFKERDNLNQQLSRLKYNRENYMNENKIEYMNRLNKLAKCAKNTQDRQKANSLLNSLGMGLDVKDEVKKFLKKMDKEMKKDESLNEINTQINYYGVQYRNMRTGIHQLLYTDTKENAQQILNYLNRMEKMDTYIYSEEEIEHQINFLWQQINRLALGGFEINYRDVKEDGMYDDIFIINYADPKPDIYESLNEESLQKIKVDSTYRNLKNIKENKMSRVSRLLERFNKLLNEISDETVEKTYLKRVSNFDDANQKEKEAFKKYAKARNDFENVDFIDDDDEFTKRKVIKNVTNAEWEDAKTELDSASDKLRKNLDLTMKHKFRKNEEFNKFIVNMMKDGNVANDADDNLEQFEFGTMQEAIAEVIRLSKSQPQAYIELVNLANDKILFNSDEVRAENIDFEDAGIEVEEKVNEEFTDEMSMLTDINDLDMPQALADTIETTEEGEVLTLGNAVEEIKSEIQNLKDELKDDITDIKDEVQAELSAEDLADIDDIEFEELQDDVEDLQDDVEDLEADEADLVDSESEEVEDEVKDEDTLNDEEDTEDEEMLEESFKKFIKKGYLEDLQKTKQTVDQMNREGKSASQIKDTITVMSDNEKEEDQAKDYAVSKIKESLLQTKYSSKLRNL